MRILLIEDTVSIAEAIQEYFIHHNHPLDWCDSAESAEKIMQYQAFDMLILDINLPGISGFELLQRLRNHGKNIPILVLTARAEIDDRISALDLGADDYLVKPFDFRELLARCRALSRRERGVATNEIICGNLVFNSATLTLKIEGKSIELQQREVRLLELFLNNFDRVLTKNQIADRLYTFDEAYTPNAIEKILSRLRKSLEGASLHIKTIRGLGYLAHVDD